MAYTLGYPKLISSFMFRDLDKINKNDTIANETRKPSLANTYKNEPEFQKAENLSRNYIRSGQQKFADPFPNISRPYDDYYNGRNLSMLNTIEANKNKDFPDVITKNPLNVVGYY